MRDEALRLKAEGLTVSAIAERLGVPRSTVGGWVCPRRVCSDCGGPKGTHGRRFDRCGKCGQERKAWRHSVRLSIIEGCWADGWTIREIAVVLGRADHPQSRQVGPELDELRRQGRAPYRYAMEDGRRVATRAA